jgi:zinc transport system substrate-binding protein
LAFSAPAYAELKVTVTIKPIHALVAGVMQGAGEPALLITGAGSPHTYALKPSDARALNASDVVFRVSERIEPFTGKVVRSLPGKVQVVTLMDSPGLTLLETRSSDTFEGHEHAHAEHGDDDHDRLGAHHVAIEQRDEEDAASHGYDGHVWLDPENAAKMVAEIARVLSEKDPAGAATYKANAERITAELAALETEITHELTSIKGKPFVVFHDAYQYFERRFGLTAVGSITASPEVQPSAKRLSEIRSKIAALDAACVFAEPQFQPKLVAAVTEGTNARSGTLDPEGALVTPGPHAYTTLLKNLSAGLKACLGNGS